MLIFTGPLLTFKLAVVYTMDLHVCSGLKLKLEQEIQTQRGGLKLKLKQETQTQTRTQKCTG